jgi:hypothetical protein
LPNAAVTYPAAAIFVAMPVMLRGMAAKPETGSDRFEISAALLSALTWYGWRPDCSAERVGLQHLYAYARSSSMPSRTSASSAGVCTSSVGGTAMLPML